MIYFTNLHNIKRKATPKVAITQKIEILYHSKIPVITKPRINTATIKPSHALNSTKKLLIPLIDIANICEKGKAAISSFPF